MPNPVDIITKKRDGGTLTPEEIDFFVQGFAHGAIPDYQAAAWAMAIYFRGMSVEETTALTLSMAASGEQFDLHTGMPPGTVIVDKHSSGGVGDKTTIAVAPIVAACGLPVGKMSGRGLSFTGGTIDKLESFAGWSPELGKEQFLHQLRTIGLVIAGQTADLAPADKALYALRDVTGTVPSLPLIAASIMSKKLAAGADAIVLDVKCGRGAFMETLEDARALSRLMVGIGQGAGRKVTALITQMEQPLGRMVGHALEVAEALVTLEGSGPPDFQELVERLSAEMLMLGAGLQADEAHRRVVDAIESGAALDKLRAFVVAQGGDPAPIDDPTTLYTAPLILPVHAPQSGWVQAIDAREVGLAVVDMGGGRHKKGDTIDHRVGVQVLAKVGTQVKENDPLFLLFAPSAEAAEQATARLQAAWRIGPDPVPPLPIVLDRVAG
jgi:pyrimidine-nucleoside phosphorylase